MKKSVTNKGQLHPMMVFVLGILTGALAVGLVFFYKSMSPNQYESAVLQSTINARAVQQVTPLRVNVALPTPIGGSVALPTPIGGKVLTPMR